VWTPSADRWLTDRATGARATNQGSWVQILPGATFQILSTSKPGLGWLLGEIGDKPHLSTKVRLDTAPLHDHYRDAREGY